MTALASALLSILALPSTALSPSAEGPNVVFVLADDMGYGDPGCYDARSKTPTPNVDRLAAEGMRFTDAHAPGALCVPSRYGLLTGRYPLRADLSLRGRCAIEPSRTTLATFLREQGYATAMVGKWHLGFEGGTDVSAEQVIRGGPLDHGFDSFFGIPASLDIPPYYYVRDRRAVAPPTGRVEASQSDGWTDIQGAFWRAGRAAPGFEHGEVLPRFVEEATGWLDARAASGAEEPFFLYVALTGPHTPWLPSKARAGTTAAGLYGDFVATVDDAFGAILAALDRNGLAEDTLVVFTSDNGPVWYADDVERFGHRSVGPLRGMKADAWEGGHRVPFVVRWPGRVPAGASSAQTTCFVDVLPTLAGVLGVEPPADVERDGVDLSGVLAGEESAEPAREITVLKYAASALRAGRWKLIDHLGSGGFSRPGKVEPAEGDPTGQLYDLDADPGEQRNLWSERPELAAELLARLRPFQHRAAAVERPNFVIVLADDMGYGDSSAYGGWVETPALDRMAAEGLRFTDFHTSGTVCSPTRAGLMTGRYQQRAGIPAVVNADPEHPTHAGGLRDVEQTFAERLREVGYATGLVGKWHLGYGPEHNPTRHGFDAFHGFVAGNVDYASRYDRMGTYDWWDGTERVEEEGYTTDLITAHAVRFVQEHADEPFCLLVAHAAVHDPIQTRDDPPGRGPDADRGARRERLREERVREMMSALDGGVAALRDALWRTGVAERTLMVFLSDNGGAGHTRNDPWRGKKGSVWEGGHRVPALAWWPGRISPGSASAELASSLDLMPTMLALAGLEPSEERPLDGRDLTPLLLHGEPLGERSLHWNAKATRAGRWKLVLGEQGPQLFDLDADPGETSDLVTVHPERAASMRDELEAWTRDVSGASTPR